MTAEEWVSSDEPERMVEFLRGRVSKRKLRLFACACARRLWSELTDPRSRRAVEVAERYADGEATPEELYAAYDAAPGGQPVLNVATAVAVPEGIFDAPDVARRCRVAAAAKVRKAAARTARAAGRPLCGLVREVFGNPFHPFIPAPGWLTCNDGSVVKLATVIYDGRRWEELPLLADALEECGCADPAVLGHLRGPGPHALGCHILDALLGRS
jgi:hypothetical protein